MKTYSYFFLGILLPGAINFFAIPIFKNVLGDTVYGEYNLLMTTLLMSNMVIVGWISHSIIRLTSQAENKIDYIKNSLWVSTFISLAAAVVSLIVLLIIQDKILVSVLFAFLLATSSMQLVLNGAVQYHLKANILMYSECVRVGIGFLIGYGLIIIDGKQYPIEKLFLGLLISNLLSCVISFKGIGLRVTDFRKINFSRVLIVGKELWGYGIYLMLWFFCTYAIMYNDRYFIYFLLGKDVASNYTALFDIITRTITLSASPLLMSTFPIMAKSYDIGEFARVNRILWRMLLIELACLPVAIILYFLFGFEVLQQLLKLPPDETKFFLAGVLILAGSIIYQLGMVAHKKMELRKETSKMFKIVLGVVSFTVVSNLFVIRSFGIIGAAFVYMLATTGYLAIVLLKTKKENMDG